MNLTNFNTNWNKPAIFTAQTYGTKTTVEIDHSDLDLDEVMNAFETLIIGMGYSKDSLKDWVIEKASQYQEEDTEYLKHKLNEWKEDDWNEEKEKQFWAEQPPHPFATDVELEAMGERPPIEDDEFDDYGMKKKK